MTSLVDRPTADGSGQSQPPATTAYAAGTLPSCGRHAIKYEIVCRRVTTCKLGDFLVENRAYSSWTIKSDDFIGKQIRPIFA